MISRWITTEIKRKIGQAPAVALLGARQVGKTTLAKTIAKGMDSIYLDLEAPEDLFKLSDPAVFLNAHNDKLVILDEIQRVPGLFPVLRGLIDKNREQGRNPGNFFFYRTAAGAEINLVIRMPSSEIWAVEIKYGSAPKLGRHYSAICDDVGATRKYLIYAAVTNFPLAAM